MSNLVLISSFYNEEYLLPWWLNWHKDIFDHGVLFDYFSTDRSVEIINEICPTWEVRETRNEDWSFVDNDKEFMEAESEFDGYKMVLTTTEFLVGELPELPSQPTCYSMPFFRLVDTVPEEYPTYDKNLVDQKSIGFIDKSSKRRFLHNYTDGEYGVGRHDTSLDHEDVDMWIYKYVFSPWTEEFIERRLQMKKYINEKEVKRGWGVHHSWGREKLFNKYDKALEKELRDGAF